MASLLTELKDIGWLKLKFPARSVMTEDQFLELSPFLEFGFEFQPMLRTSAVLGVCGLGFSCL